MPRLLANMVTVVKVETLADKLANVEVKALIDTLVKTIAGIQALQQRYRCYTLAKVEDRALVDTLGHRIAEKIRTFYNTVGKTAAEVFVNKVAPTIAVVTVRTLGDKLTKVGLVRNMLRGLLTQLHG